MRPSQRDKSIKNLRRPHVCVCSLAPPHQSILLLSLRRPSQNSCTYKIWDGRLKICLKMSLNKVDLKMFNLFWDGRLKVFVSKFFETAVSKLVNVEHMRYPRLISTIEWVPFSSILYGTFETVISTLNNPTGKRDIAKITVLILSRNRCNLQYWYLVTVLLPDFVIGRQYLQDRSLQSNKNFASNDP